MSDVWTKPGNRMPPLHNQVLVTLKEDPCEAIDVACYTGLPETEQGAWIGTGGRFYTRQIAAWMTLAAMSRLAELRKKQEEDALWMRMIALSVLSAQRPSAASC